MNTTTSLLDSIIYITGASFIFFGIPNLVMFGAIQLMTRKIETGSFKKGRK